MVLYLLQVLGCSVLMDLRNKATHSFALFTTVSELNIRFFATNKQLMLPWQQWSSTQYLIACKICGIFWKGVLESLTHVFTDLKISKESNFLIQVIVMWSGSTISSESFSARRLRKQLQSAHIPPLVPKKLGSKRSHFNVQHRLLVSSAFSPPAAP